MLMLVLFGCATSSERDEALELSGPIVLAASIGGPRTAPPKNVFPVLQVVPGTILGNPLDSPVIPIAPAGATEFRFSHADLEQSFSKEAMPQTPASLARGVTVLPQATRIARAGTFGNDQHGTFSGGAFVVGDSARPLVLIYVDRPSEILGSASAGGDTYRFDVSLQTSGFYWLTTTDGGDVVLADSVAGITYVLLRED